MLIQLDERILSDIFRSLLLANDQERRLEDGAILGSEEALIFVVDVGHPTPSRLAGDIDSALLDGCVHIVS
jgi:hypothetical protein